MLLTITMTRQPATDLGFLLHKHPDRFQSFDLSFGKAHVFYSEAGADRCTACLLLDVDPVGMVRGKNPNQNFLLGQYVNDRPYAASSFLSVAIAQVFGAALQGRCKDRPELATMPILLTARIDVLPVRGGERFLQAIFEPLGYEIEAVRSPLDERFPEWGDSPYFSVTVRTTATLAELLTHLYVLVPVFDNRKHYFVGEDEMEKLLAKGEGWLASHPEKEEITRRYLRFQSSLYTRTGRRFFNEPELEGLFLDRVRSALTAADLWATLETTWVCLDCELMPWSAKAQELLKTQYAAVGAAGQASLPRAVACLAQAVHPLEGEERTKVEQAEGEYQRREENLGKFVAAYRQYCWSVASVTDLKLAPFHLLASEGHVHTGKNHTWHMDTLAAVCRADSELLRATATNIVDVTDPASEAAGIEWWSALTGRGGEGMVVKPLDFILRGRRGLAQPGVKCRGREYLRIIYGPDYTADENLSRLRSRGLGHKRSLALGEFALGIEGLERFVRREPLRRVHECVFAVLALESEPADPRL
jgi:hypothetical protein